MRLALWQGSSPARDLDAACIQAEAALTAAAAMGAAALVLPEVWLPGYNQSEIPALALPLDSAPLHRLARAARQHATALAVGYAERDGDLLYNSAACFGPDGSLLCNYRKVQLYGTRETGLYAPGDALPTFPLAGETAAILICYDVEFAPHVKSLADRGATVILVPTANMAPFTRPRNRSRDGRHPRRDHRLCQILRYRGRSDLRRQLRRRTTRRDPRPGGEIAGPPRRRPAPARPHAPLHAIRRT